MPLSDSAKLTDLGTVFIIIVSSLFHKLFKFLSIERTDN